MELETTAQIKRVNQDSGSWTREFSGGEHYPSQRDFCRSPQGNQFLLVLNIGGVENELNRHMKLEKL